MQCTAIVKLQYLNKVFLQRVTAFESHFKSNVLKVYVLISLALVHLADKEFTYGTR